MKICIINFQEFGDTALGILFVGLGDNHYTGRNIKIPQQTWKGYSLLLLLYSHFINGIFTGYFQQFTNQIDLGLIVSTANTFKKQFNDNGRYCM